MASNGGAGFLISLKLSPKKREVNGLVAAASSG